MRVPDYVSGLIILVLSGAALIMALDFPSAIGQPLGPSVFPIVITSVLAVCGLLLIVGSVYRRLAGVASSDAEDATDEPPISFTTLGVMALVIGLPVFYMLAVTSLGFLLTSFLVLIVSTVVLWGGLIRSTLFSLASCVVIDGVFRGVFGIPLDLGLVHIPWW